MSLGQRYPESGNQSDIQKAKNAVTAKIVRISNGYLVHLGTEPPVYCENIEDESGNCVVDKLVEFYEDEQTD